MQAYEIKLTDYIVKGTEHLRRTDESGDIELDESGKPMMGALYPLKKNMLDVFLSCPAVGRAVLDASKLANKINDCIHSAIYLDKSEYNLLTNSFEVFEHFRPTIDGEMAERVFEAKQVEMEPKTKQ